MQKVTSSTERRPVWFIYSGMGTQWAGMGREMMRFGQFRRTIRKCSAVLEPFHVNLQELILNGSTEHFENTLNCFIVITSIQV